MAKVVDFLCKYLRKSLCNSCVNLCEKPTSPFFHVDLTTNSQLPSPIFTTFPTTSPPLYLLNFIHYSTDPTTTITK